MVPDLTLEVLYYNQPTDFKMEFELCGCCNIRFLNASAKNRNDFLTALSKSVIRSRVIIAVGSFNPLDQEYLPKIIAKATGYVLQPVDKTDLAIQSAGEFPLPQTAVPLVTTAGELGGCVLENADQSIIMLTGDRTLRHELVSDLVCPYLTFFADKKGKTTPADQRITPAPQAEPTESEKAIPTEITESAAQQADTIPASEPSTLADEAELLAGAKHLVDLVLDETTEQSAPESQEQTYTVLEQPDRVVSHFDLADFLTDEPSDADEPIDKRVRRRWLRVMISIVLVIAVLLSAYFGYEWVFQPMQTNSVYSDTRALYGQSWEKLPEDMLYKFGRLYQTNSDLFGWLSIPETSINHPVVSAAGRSPFYYETHLFDGSANRFGTLYTDNVSSKEGFTRNIVIRGKDLKNGTMLSDLKKYLDIDHYKEAPTFSFDTLYVENKWKIFSVFELKNLDEIETNFFDDAAFEEYLAGLTRRSILDTNIDVNAADQLITLVCEGEKRHTVVVARCVREEESPLVDVTATELNQPQEMLSSHASSAAAVIATPSILEEISSIIDKTSSVDPNMADGTSSRFEQSEMAGSAITVKPTASKNKTSSKKTSSTVTSAKTSSKTSSKKNTSTTTSKKTETSSNAPAVDLQNLPTLTVTNQFTAKKVSGPANEIIAQIIEAEMGSSYHVEALKAQAVAAYSWLLCNGAAEGKAPSAPMKTAGKRAIQAANAVAGQVAVYQDKVAQTYYYAISAGKTANSSDIWSSQLPYLVSVDSSVDKNVSGYQTIRKYDADDIAKWAKELLGVDLTKISNKSNWFKCTYDANKVYVKTVKIGSSEQKGTYLRNTFFNSFRVGSANVLRSSAYTIKYDSSNDKFTFTVRGYGHGVGMSQTGANVYAQNGWGYEKILKHYYTGISLGTYYED